MGPSPLIFFTYTVGLKLINYRTKFCEYDCRIEQTSDIGDINCVDSSWSIFYCRSHTSYQVISLSVNI